ncbi:flavonol synthase 2 [Striga asiatica]|uniref:Flavonol synthase 2 n=1 Tax=Striga asiatica TaxID=4170 RepID=A0A5A7RCV6_STRAF|nr:flavonol synthase 2 [Striga asiatica]
MDIVFSVVCMCLEDLRTCTDTELLSEGGKIRNERKMKAENCRKREIKNSSKASNGAIASVPEAQTAEQALPVGQIRLFPHLLRLRPFCGVVRLVRRQPLPFTRPIFFTTKFTLFTVTLPCDVVFFLLSLMGEKDSETLNLLFCPSLLLLYRNSLRRTHRRDEDRDPGGRGSGGAPSPSGIGSPSSFAVRGGDMDLVLRWRDPARGFASRPRTEVPRSSATSDSARGERVWGGRRRWAERLIGRIWPLQKSSSAEVMCSVAGKPNSNGASAY